MKLFVGLGNPGERYARHRHNVGFMAVERIADRHRFGPWRQRFQGRLAEGLLDGERIWLLEPQTFMNESGRAVAEAARFMKLPMTDIVIFHDELDLAAGKVRVKLGGESPATTACAVPTPAWARASSSGSGSASATPATRTGSPGMSCRTSTRPSRSGSSLCSTPWPTRRRCSPGARTPRS